MASPIRLIIFDLDGTLIETETLVLAIAREVVKQFDGKELTEEAIAATIGRRPVDAWQAVADLLQIPATGQELFEHSEPLLTQRWHEVPLLPGAERLLVHLKASGITLALATSTSTATLEKKISNKQCLQDAFPTHLICCGDDVEKGKPSPDCFLQVAAAANVHPSQCLVFEDAPSGIAAATAAGMRVIVIPSIPTTTTTTSTTTKHYPDADSSADSGVVEILPSLLSFRPEKYGLPPFTDFICGSEAIPLHPVWRISGTVVRGFGRGSKELGIPTANLDSAALAGAMGEAVTGIYAGFASLGGDTVGREGEEDSASDSVAGGVYPMVMSVGYNPVFGNTEKTCEPWLLHDFKGKSFYGVAIRLVVVAFLRPEANFPSVEALVERIHKDGEVARAVLQEPTLMKYKEDSFLMHD